MACVRKRRGKWVVDYRDAAGVRRWLTCQTKREAESALADAVREARQPTRPIIDPNLTIGQYAERWVALIRQTIKPRTLKSYQDTVRLHLLPTLAAVQVRKLHKGQVKALLAAKLQAGLSRNSVRIIHATLRAMLNAAVDDGVILANPADKLARKLKLTQPAKAHQEEVKALSREQLAGFLATAAEVEPRCAPLFFTMARTGLRLGEALALQWEDVDTAAREIRVARAFSGGELGTPKSGHGRTVDMSRQLAGVFDELWALWAAEKLRRGWKDMPPWVFRSTAGTPLDLHNVEKAFKRVLKKASLPLHFSPHSLRHTYASLLLQQGESPVYVQRQLGHASIQLTVDTYGKWLPMGNKAAVDRLDDGSGSRVVATGDEGLAVGAELREMIGGPRGNRTPNPLIKSQLLCQLS